MLMLHLESEVLRECAKGWELAYRRHVCFKMQALELRMENCTLLLAH